MRGPLEGLLTLAGKKLGLTVRPLGEASLSDLKVRPDYAIEVNGAVCGYVEVKAPGKGADPSLWKAGSHDRLQWEKLKALPNVLYTDGNAWSVYRSGEREGGVALLERDLRLAGDAPGPADEGLARLLATFLTWKPVQPRSINQLVHSVAGLTRLLRDEIADTLQREEKAGGGPFTDLAGDWRELLFPDAEALEFADGYAQTITFALLLARNEGIAFDGRGVTEIAKALGKTHSLMGKALDVLTDDSIGVLSVTLGTLVRVVGVVDWSRFEKHKADPYLYLYERFLEEYDPQLRKRSGSYYTPHEVVAAMTRLADDVLRTRLGRQEGLASEDVTVVDPAMGTGAYILEVIEKAAATVATEQGPGAVPAFMRSFAKRVIGFEKQLGPFAVAELRAAEAFRRHDAVLPDGGLRLYVTDTLDDPFVEETRLGTTYEAIAVSRRSANKVKATEPVVVVIGNPPYAERAKGHGGWIETGDPKSGAGAPLHKFREPGNGRAEYVLSNLYVFFWRWATWKVFDAHPASPAGVICFITTAGYLSGPGFKGMRRYLRENTDEGWIIDCTPEGHQPPVNTRVFPGVQQPLAIGIFVRHGAPKRDQPAGLRFARLSGLQDAKFEALSALSIDDADAWQDCPAGWTAPFLPEGGALWASSPLLGDLMPWQIPGIKPNRTWVYAPDAESLKARWKRLVEASDAEKPVLFNESRDASLAAKKPGLPGFPHDDVPFGEENGACPEPVRVSFRSFDEQWIIPDDRLLATPRPDLWRVRDSRQTYVTEQHDQQVRGGPALTFAANSPDMHHFDGRGGRVLPLYSDAAGLEPNVAPGLIALVSDVLACPVEAADLLAYIAGVTAQPAFTATFSADLVTPGIRVPLTRERELWSEAVALGREVLWLHTRGQRYFDAAASKPQGPPKVGDHARAPKVVIGIPDSPEEMPDSLAYDPATRTLRVGGGAIAPVDPRVVAYSVSSMNVLRKWFGYRQKTRQGAKGTPLDEIRPKAWSPTMTKDLLELLHVLTRVVDLEERQAELLERLVQRPLITVADLVTAGVLPVPAEARTPSSARPSKPASAQVSMLDE